MFDTMKIAKLQSWGR